MLSWLASCAGIEAHTGFRSPRRALHAPCIRSQRALCEGLKPFVALCAVLAAPLACGKPANERTICAPNSRGSVLATTPRQRKLPPVIYFSQTWLALKGPARLACQALVGAGTGLIPSRFASTALARPLRGERPRVTDSALRRRGVGELAGLAHSAGTRPDRGGSAGFAGSALACPLRGERPRFTYSALRRRGVGELAGLAHSARFHPAHRGQPSLAALASCRRIRRKSARATRNCPGASWRAVSAFGAWLLVRGVSTAPRPRRAAALHARPAWAERAAAARRNGCGVGTPASRRADTFGASLRGGSMRRAKSSGRLARHCLACGAAILSRRAVLWLHRAHRTILTVSAGLTLCLARAGLERSWLAGDLRAR